MNAESKNRGGKRAGAGRKPGIPNRVTTEAREAIALFVEGNADKLQEWLDRVADGVPANPRAGQKAIPPNPQKAFELLMSVVEYHIPKLARSELTGRDGKELPTSVAVRFV